MEILTGALLLLVTGASPHFDLVASFEPAPKVGANGRVAVTFTARDPDVHINEEPGPRLRLDPDQHVLVDKQAPSAARSPSFDPDDARYLDLAKPVLFPVAFAPGAPKGRQTVKASVVFFYCSKREAWCRRGQSEIEVPVTVP